MKPPHERTPISMRGMLRLLPIRIVSPDVWFAFMAGRHAEQRDNLLLRAAAEPGTSVVAHARRYMLVHFARCAHHNYLRNMRSARL